MLIDDIIVKAQEGVTQQEINIEVAKEKEIWAAKGKKIASINVTIEGDELVIKSVERSPITRIRRITGYLSSEDKFNDAKRAELNDRVAQL